MKKKPFSSLQKFLVAISTLAIIFIIIIVYNTYNDKLTSSIKVEIVEGYSEIMDTVLNEYLTGTGTNKWGDTRDNEYALKCGLQEINYQINDITIEDGLYGGRDDDTYVLNIEVRLTCSGSSSGYDRQELAQEVYWTFRDVQSITSGIEIGEYECSYYPTEDPHYAYEDLITIYVNDIKIRSPYYHEAVQENNADDNSVKCRRSGCGEDPVYTDWDRRYCSEHLRDTHYCRYPGCMNEIPNSTGFKYCGEHD